MGGAGAVAAYEQPGPDAVTSEATAPKSVSERPAVNPARSATPATSAEPARDVRFSASATNLYALDRTACLHRHGDLPWAGTSGLDASDVLAQADITRPPDNTLTVLLKDPG